MTNDYPQTPPLNRLFINPSKRQVVSRTRRALNWILDLLFPVKCVNCDSKFGEYLCRHCLSTIAIKKDFECIGCKRNTPLGMTCYFCQKENFVDRLLIVADYKDKAVGRILKAFKYRFISDLSESLALLTRSYLKGLTKNKKFNIFQDNPIIIPVPLFRLRLNWRGFNQSQLLADKLGKTFQMEVMADNLVRTKKATPQVDIEDREQRLTNVKGLFKCLDARVSGRNIILLDDVCTTGATLNECARALKESGATKVIALVMARG